MVRCTVRCRFDEWFGVGSCAGFDAGVGAGFDVGFDAGSGAGSGVVFMVDEGAPATFAVDDVASRS